jgi:phage minor structural protein
MLTLYTSAGAVPLEVDDYHIRTLASGLDELEFNISIWDDKYPLIQEEANIREQHDSTQINYLVKAIDGGGDTATVKAQIDLDAWKASLTVGYKSASLPVGPLVRSVAPAGWTVIDSSGISYSRTVELESATPMDVLEQCRDTFPGVTFRFDNVQKTVEIVNMDTQTSIGAFVTRDLNLRQNNYKGKSTGFITRLYAYGKDGLSFASINGGKPYVENHTYGSRIICGYWKDERYTVAANLKQAAQDKLDALAIPQRSFDCDVVDLAAVDPDKYSFLDFQLFTVASLIDQTRSGAKIDHQVVELWVYPYRPDKNKVVLSTSAPRIQSQVSQIINNFNNVNSAYQQQQSSAQRNAIENATAQITGAKGGNMRAIYDSSGNWTELVVMNTDSILTASKLWRFNLGGFGYSPNGYNGPYTTAITMDGAIVADFITTGTLNAALAEIINLNASNITAGTLSADRIAANSIAVAKLTGSIKGGLSNSWELDLTAGTLTIGNINAANITTGTLNAARIAANSITADKISVDNLQAISASLAGWTLSASALSKTVENASRVFIQAPAAPTSNSLALLVQDWYNSAWRTMFSVSYAGALYARNANISGTITATAGTIGGCSISNGVLQIANANIGSLNVDKLNGQIVSNQIANSAITTAKIASYDTNNPTTTGIPATKIRPSAITNEKLNNGAVSYGKTSFTGTLDQVGTNKSNIAAIKTLFTTTLATNNLTVGSQFTFQNHQIQAISGYLRYTS